MSANPKSSKSVFPLFFIVFALIDLLVMRGILARIPALEGAAEAGTFGEVLWKERSFDLIGQLAVILAGVLCRPGLVPKERSS